MNRREIDIIRASSCTGNRIFFKGCNTFSNPSVNSIGVVVRVNNDDTNTNKKKRIDI